MYTGNPLINPIDALRLEVGDTDCKDVWLDDNDYKYFLANNVGDRKGCIHAAASAILFKLARYTRERVGQVEVYGAEAYKNYADALERKAKSLYFGRVNPISFFGGVYRDDMVANATDPAIVDQPFYRGQSDGEADFLTKRDYVYTEWEYNWFLRS